MSAIAGFWSFDGRPARSQVDRSLKGLSAYGSSTASWDDGTIALGRNLHSILPEDRFDRGPIADGRHTLVADVRLDNRSELGALLGYRADRLGTLSDARLLFDCLIRWGDQAFDRLVGEFAFAWWDSKARKLILARDTLGHRPLYFHRDDRFFAFASMPSGLHALPEIPREFDAPFMAETLMLLPRLDERTHFRGIHRVRPAHWMSIEPSRQQATRYWLPAPGTRFDDPREYEEELRRLVDQAVTAQLRGSGQSTCTHLSGGLDSSIVTTSVASQHPGRAVLAFTAVPGNDFVGEASRGIVCNEGTAAAEVARRYSNIRHFCVDSGEASPLAALDREHYYHQEPVSNLESAAWGRSILSRTRAHDARVLLTGVVGNISATYAGIEQLGAYVRAGKTAKACGLALALKANGMSWPTIGAQGIGPFLPPFLWTAAARARGWVTDIRGYTAIRPDLISPVMERCRSLQFDISYRPSSDPLQARLDVLNDCDGGNYFKGVLANWGVSVREPLADRRVIDFCVSIPPGEFVRNGIPRSLARRAFADRLPNSIVKNVRRGYQSADWYMAIRKDFPTLQNEVEAIARCEAAQEVLDPDWLRTSVSNWPRNGWNSRKIVMRYRYGLLRAVSAGHFMRKVAGTN